MQKMVIICLFSILSVSCGASNDEEAAATSGQESSSASTVGSKGDEAAVIAELNETCEENWCAGEFNYKFLSIKCNETTCELSFLAERRGKKFEDSVVFEYDQPLVDDGYLEAGNWERVSDAISDEWEPAQSIN